MKSVAIPYHTGSPELKVAKRNLEAVATGAVGTFDPGKDEESIVRDSLGNPVGAAPSPAAGISARS